MLLINIQDLQEDQEPPVTIMELSSLVEQLSLSPIQEHEVREIRGKLRDCAEYSGVGVICNLLDEWKPMEPHLTSSGYKIISNYLSPHLGRSLFNSIAWSIAYPKPPTAAESSRSPPFVIAVFVSGIGVDLAHHTIMNSYNYEEMRIVDDIIQPFLPQSAPHLQNIPKLFFITARGNPRAPPPHFPDDPDGNYCAAYHMTQGLICMQKWTKYISDSLFFPGMTVQEAIENSKSHLEKGKECLHYFTCLQNKSLVLK